LEVLIMGAYDFPVHVTQGNVHYWGYDPLFGATLMNPKGDAKDGEQLESVKGFKLKISPLNKFNNLARVVCSSSPIKYQAIYETMGTVVRGEAKESERLALDSLEDVMLQIIGRQAFSGLLQRN
jgi:hypothetical protein